MIPLRGSIGADLSRHPDVKVLDWGTPLLSACALGEHISGQGLNESRATDALIVCELVPLPLAEAARRTRGARPACAGQAEVLPEEEISYQRGDGCTAKLPVPQALLISEIRF